MEQELFMEGLENLKIFARSNDNKVKKRDVQDCLGDNIKLDDSQWQMIAGYLKLNQIELLDVEISGNSFEQMEKEAEQRAKEEQTKQNEAEEAGKTSEADDSRLLAMYMEDLKSIVPLSPMAEAVILQDVCDKDAESREVIVNNYLLKVVDWAKKYTGRGVALMDLIQEANIVVMDELGRRDWMKQLDAFDVMDSVDAKQWMELAKRLEEYLYSTVERVLLSLIEKQTGEQMVGSRIVSVVNRVNDAAKKAYSEYRRNVTVEELSEYAGISTDDIMEALRLSGNKIENVVVPE